MAEPRKPLTLEEIAEKNKKTIKYWEDREVQFGIDDIQDDRTVSKRIDDLVKRMTTQAAERIYIFYGKYAENQKIRREEAIKRIDSIDLEDFEEMAARFVHDKDFSDYANQLLKAFNTKMYVSRERMLINQLHLIITHGTAQIEKVMTDYMQSSLYKELKRQGGILGATFTVSKARLEAIIHNTFKGVRWSERLWSDMKTLNKVVSDSVSNSILAGIHPNRFVPALKKKLQQTASNAKRLLITETARIQDDAQERSWKALLTPDEWKTAQYKFIAIIDEKTSHICESLHGKKFKVTEAKRGLNCPPMHPYCRSRRALAVADNWRNKFKGKYAI